MIFPYNPKPSERDTWSDKPSLVNIPGKGGVSRFYVYNQCTEYPGCLSPVRYSTVCKGDARKVKTGKGRGLRSTLLVALANIASKTTLGNSNLNYMHAFNNNNHYFSVLRGRKKNFFFGTSKGMIQWRSYFIYISTPPVTVLGLFYPPQRTRPVNEPTLGLDRVRQEYTLRKRLFIIFQ